MQIIRTEVTQATAPTGQPILRVIFCGEGGDCVAVDLARVVGGNNEAAINRAKAVLVQIATFDLAVNDYDARSNGNFDEVAVTAANDENGGLHIFEYRRTRPSGSSLQDAKFRGCAGGSGSMRYRSSGVDLQPGTDDLQVGSCACATRTANCCTPSTCRRRKRPA
ncbi:MULTISPECIES: hypothetical protein [unclassified Mesorhizobium]|uniref:hypothetical protein n=1 Tax=unclassified Mesorhizobium TaxID=325217 RepID=UPI0003CFBD45|nr:MULTISPECIES: hypothetical protein [unclassified Mesorhizobium]ESZ07901.1 hypothetical protein X737_33975 [Mesorhizobium sp. L48C026A00]RWN48764.1 MAG: hypothetical protein EOR98_35015 [Mesorhizobium sp.]RWN68477.1 MAG: hypothetical protein EOS01_35280 [Mesorhizobium sp.]RWN69410.1 MAG: hypothetical protein EOS02_35000 [Mesorhizobium sp.]RWN79967.1 MAG: hypothetical protein EOS04_34925 [Mesorhizobium sp.]